MSSSSSSKTCSSRKKTVNEYTRKEIVALIKERFPTMTASEIKKTNKTALCQLLSIPVVDATAPAPVVVASGGCIERSAKALKDHQLAVVRHFDTHHGLLVFHKVGSGKTLTAITVSQCYLDAHPTHRVVVITPAGLLNNFKSEMKNSYANLSHADRYSFYSYQTFMNRGKSGEENCDKDTLLIVDEAHNLRRMYKVTEKTGKRYGIMNRYVTQCAKRAHKVLLLSGTPIYNGNQDIVALYNMISGKASVKPNDFNMKDMKCLVSFRGASPEFFPKRVNKNEYIVMSPSYEEKYNKVIETLEGGNRPAFLVDLYGETNLSAFYNGVRRAVNNLENMDSAKIQWILQKVRANPTEKFVVFSHFLDAGINNVIQGLGEIDHGVIRGDVPMAARKRLVDDFNRGVFNVLFISKAGGEGLDLKGVRNVIIMEPAWNDATEEQVIGRAIRYKSHEGLPASQQSVTVWSLYHIRPTDDPQKLEKYLTNLRKQANAEEERIPFSPTLESFDLFMRGLIIRKQYKIDRYNKQLRQLSIEKNTCP